MYDNTNSGVLFGNLDSSEPHKDRTPNFSGSVNVDGKEWRLSGWVRIGKEGGKMAGKKFLSLKVEEARQRTSDGTRGRQYGQNTKTVAGKYDYHAAEQREMDNLPKKATKPAEDFDDDIPFVFAHIAPIGFILGLATMVLHGA